MLHLHNNYSFTESLVETVFRSLRHSCRSELHEIPRFPVAQTIRSPDRSDLRISLPEYFRFPDGFISIARLMICSRPSTSRCLLSFTSLQIRANRSTSACFEENNGYVSKWGRTFSTKCLTFLT